MAFLVFQCGFVGTADYSDANEDVVCDEIYQDAAVASLDVAIYSKMFPARRRKAKRSTCQQLWR